MIRVAADQLRDLRILMTCCPMDRRDAARRRARHALQGGRDCASRSSIRARTARRCRRSAISRSIARSTRCRASPPIARCCPTRDAEPRARPRSRSRPASRSAAIRCSRTRSPTSSRSPASSRRSSARASRCCVDERDDRHPLVIAGGPLTFSNPAPLAPFCRRDHRRRGRGAHRRARRRSARDVGFVRERAVGRARRPARLLPAAPPRRDACRRSPQADDALLPARSVIATPHTELADMFMTEAARGCSRGCTYCVMRRSTNGGMRIVPRETIIAGIPEGTRAGRPGRRGGHRPPGHRRDRARRRRRRPRGRHLEPARRQAHRRARRPARARRLPHADRRRRWRERAHAPRRRALDPRRAPDRAPPSSRATHRLHTLKVYMMLGVPSETDADVDELVAASQASSPRSTRASRTASRRSSPSATRRSTARRSPASTSSRPGSPGCAKGSARGGPRRQGRGPPDLGALGLGRVHARAGRVVRRARGHGRAPRRRQLRRVQEGVRARAASSRPARAPACRRARS